MHSTLARTLRKFRKGTFVIGLVGLWSSGAWAQNLANDPATDAKGAAQFDLNTKLPQPMLQTLVAQMPALPPPPPPPPTSCTTPDDVYKNFECLDAFLGEDFFTRLFNYYRLEWGQPGPPEDPNAPPGRIEGWPRPAATTPPLPYTEWPMGALTYMGVTRPNSVDSPFMAAIANTSVGRWMYDNHIQFYGWVNGGFNLSTNSTQPNGNFPIGYAYTPNVAQFDQGVFYIERLPDTVQIENFDWGFRLSFLYGENYRFTNSYGLGSYQFNGHNNIYGWDVPMEYADLYWPKPFNALISGVQVRIGRYISIPTSKPNSRQTTSSTRIH